ncbi:MAG: trypsin-like peptidase domain-containing protein [Bacteroidia bacterium]
MVLSIKTVTATRRAASYDPFMISFLATHIKISPPQKARASGSGVIISDDGYIVTNNHVIDNAEEVMVVLNDKREYKAEVIGTDPSTDLALLKVDAKNLPFVYYGNSDDVKVGEWALAVGNPFSLTSTVTAEFISAKGRNINILNEKFAIESFVFRQMPQLIREIARCAGKRKGELIGINSAIASNTGSYAGYSFAVPVAIIAEK